MGWLSRCSALIAFSVLVAACGGGGDGGVSDAERSPRSPVSVTTSAPPKAPVSTVTTETEKAPPTTAAPTIDAAALLAKDPLVIFNAFPPKPADVTYDLPPGQRDWDELWRSDTEWATALSHVDVYRLHAFQIRQYLSDEQLTTLFAFLREHGIALMFETEPLAPPDLTQCAQTESFEGIYDIEMAQRIKELGGKIDMVAVEEPYHFGHLLDTPEACQYSVERVVDEVRDHVAAIREIFGDIPVGSIEPIWISPSTTPADMAVWLDTYAERAGEPFAFLHVDPDWTRPDWADVAIGIETVADERGVPFGILYNGGIQADGAAWMQAMAENAAELETAHGGTPQHVSIQSWVDWPDHDLPESDPTALTSGIVRYFASRVALETDSNGDGVTATLTDESGVPVVGATLAVSVAPTGRGVSSQTVTGTVPEGAVRAVALVRANAEEATVGEVDATVLEITYSEDGGSNLVPNGDFSAGSNGWYSHGDPAGSAEFVSGDFGAGVELRATTQQNIFVDGTAFDVTPGSPFEFSATYEIREESAETVVVSIEFLDIERRNIFAHLTAGSAGEVTTDTDGRANVPADMIGATPANVTLHYAGDLDHWPAAATIAVG